jgi:hypothetical protein
MITLLVWGIVFSASLLLIAGLTSNSALGSARLRAATIKPLNEFGACFARTQDDAAQPWSFVPNDRGGVFSDAGAHDVTAPYQLRVAEGTGGTRLRLFAARGSAQANRLVADVNRCR